LAQSQPFPKFNPHPLNNIPARPAVSAHPTPKLEAKEKFPNDLKAEIRHRPRQRSQSRGPKTPATRQESAQNSLQHGFTSRNTLLLACEDPDLYQRVRTEYITTCQPATPVESDLVDEMVASCWRILRIRAIETALLDSELLNQAANIRRQIPGADAGIQLALAFRSLVDQSRALALTSRYESRLHRILRRSHQTLRELQQARKAESVPAETLSYEPANPSPEPTTSKQAPSYPRP
jgi:hypothetical protein